MVLATLDFFLSFVVVYFHAVWLRIILPTWSPFLSWFDLLKGMHLNSGLKRSLNFRSWIGIEMHSLGLLGQTSSLVPHSFSSISVNAMSWSMNCPHVIVTWVKLGVPPRSVVSSAGSVFIRTSLGFGRGAPVTDLLRGKLSGEPYSVAGKSPGVRNKGVKMAPFVTLQRLLHFPVKVRNLRSAHQMRSDRSSQLCRLNVAIKSLANTLHTIEWRISWTPTMKTTARRKLEKIMNNQSIHDRDAEYILFVLNTYLSYFITLIVIVIVTIWESGFKTTVEKLIPK